MIEIKNLSKKYGDSLIFENASFSFPEKGLFCVLGPSGSGKSTLLNLIAGFDSDYEGEISVCGENLECMSRDEKSALRRDNIGFVFQNYNLLGGYTALENILLASNALGESRAESEKRALNLLEKLGLSDKAGQKSKNLSGGQKQRVAIARALINNPRVILADEPTGALDRKNSTEIMELFRELSRERLVIVITHDKKCAELADAAVTLGGGGLSCKAEIRSAEPTPAIKKAAGGISVRKTAAKNFRVHLPRYIAVALAVSLGVLCFVLSLSSGNIAEKSIAEFEEKNTAFHSGYIKANGNEAELLELLGADSRLENIYAQYVLSDVSLRIGAQSVPMPEKYPMAKAAEKLSYGVMPRRGENEIALSPSLAAKFEKNIQNLIGKTAELSLGSEKYTFTVSGIFNAGYDDFYISSDIEEKLYSGASGNAYSVSYDVKNFEEIVAVSEELKAKNIASENAAAEVGAFLKTFKNISRLFTAVSVLIFAIGIFISAVLLVKQQNTRFREVGLLASLGYDGKTISRILTAEMLLLCFISAAGSAALSAAAALCGKIFGFSIILTLPQIILALCLTALIILAINGITNLRLIRTEPVDALRK